MDMGTSQLFIENVDKGLTIAKYLSRVTDMVKYTEPVRATPIIP